LLFFKYYFEILCLIFFSILLLCEHYNDKNLFKLCHLRRENKPDLSFPI